MVDRCVPNISRMSSIYESDPPPSNKMSTNKNQIRPIFRTGTAVHVMPPLMLDTE